MTPIQLIERLSRHDYYVQFFPGEAQDWIGATSDSRHTFKVTCINPDTDTYQTATVRLSQEALAAMSLDSDNANSIQRLVLRLDKKFQREGPEGWTVD